jgi:hypothetical protein
MVSSRPFLAKYIPEVFVKMRTGGAINRSLRDIIIKSREDLRALRATSAGALGGFGALAVKILGKIVQFFKTAACKASTMQPDPRAARSANGARHEALHFFKSSQGLCK